MTTNPIKEKCQREAEKIILGVWMIPMSAATNMANAIASALEERERRVVELEQSVPGSVRSYMAQVKYQQEELFRIEAQLSSYKSVAGEMVKILEDALECDSYEDHTSGIWQMKARVALLKFKEVSGESN